MIFNNDLLASASSSDSDSTLPVSNKSKKKIVITSSTSEEDREEAQEPSLLEKFRVEADRKKKKKNLSQTVCTICQKKSTRFLFSTCAYAIIASK